MRYFYLNFYLKNIKGGGKRKTKIRKKNNNRG
jgi:hypothetical protein